MTYWTPELTRRHPGARPRKRWEFQEFPEFQEFQEFQGRNSVCYFHSGSGEAILYPGYITSTTREGPVLKEPSGQGSGMALDVRKPSVIVILHEFQPEVESLCTL